MTEVTVLADVSEQLRNLGIGFEQFRQEQQGLRSDLQALRQQFGAEMAGLREGLAAVRTDVSGLRTDVNELREGMAVMRAGMNELSREVMKLGIEFEEFRHNTKIDQEVISGLTPRVKQHDRDITGLGGRTTRVENRLGLRPLPEPSDE